MRARFPLLLALLVLAVSSLAAFGCGGGDDNETTTSAKLTSTPDISVAADPTIANAVPAAIKNKGTLTVAADATYPPDEFIAEDGKTIIGMDADLANALASVMGLKASLQNVTF